MPKGMRLTERGIILTLFQWNLSLEGITEKRHKHQENWQRYKIALNLYLGKSYRRHLQGTWSWECLRPIDDLFQWTSYRNYILRNRLEEATEISGGPRTFYKLCRFMLLRMFASICIAKYCRYPGMTVEIVAVATGTFFRSADSPATYLRVNRSNNIAHALRNG
jgi:hypothetical protein